MLSRPSAVCLPHFVRDYPKTPFGWPWLTPRRNHPPIFQGFATLLPWPPGRTPVLGQSLSAPSYLARTRTQFFITNCPAAGWVAGGSQDRIGVAWLALAGCVNCDGSIGGKGERRTRAVGGPASQPFQRVRACHPEPTPARGSSLRPLGLCRAKPEGARPLRSGLWRGDMSPRPGWPARPVQSMPGWRAGRPILLRKAAHP